MPRGGKRENAGRPRVKAEQPKANKRIATEVLALRVRPEHPANCRCELCAWWEVLHWALDLRLRFDARKYLTDKRDGKAVQNVNHIHDKPIEMNVNLSLGERMKIAMEKAEERVRGRH